MPLDFDSGSLRNMKLLLPALLALPLTLLAEGGLPTQPYIYVEGKAEIEKLADMVTLRFDVVARNADQAKANQEVQAKAGKILGMLNERKIAQNDVIAEDLRSHPQYEGEHVDPSKPGKIVGYVVTRQFTVKMRDVTAFANLVDELLALGGVEFSGIDGGLSTEKEMKDEVWEKALNDARERAEKTLRMARMKIDSVFAISPVPFPDIRHKILRGSQTYEAGETHREVVPDPLRYRLAPISVTQTVHVIYLISPLK